MERWEVCAEDRFEAYVDRLVEIIGHADRAEPGAGRSWTTDRSQCGCQESYCRDVGRMVIQQSCGRDGSPRPGSRSCRRRPQGAPARRAGAPGAATAATGPAQRHYASWLPRHVGWRGDPDQEGGAASVGSETQERLHAELTARGRKTGRSRHFRAPSCPCNALVRGLSLPELPASPDLAGNPGQD